MKKSTFFLTCILLLFSSNLWTQSVKDSVLSRYSKFAEESSPEKLFLHTDKSLYVSGEFIWFKGYLKNNTPISVFEESRFIYVELYGDTLISRVKIKYGEEGIAGRVPISHSIPTGEYTLRAYSQWMVNSLPDYMFHKKISVINPAYKDTADSVDTATVPIEKDSSVVSLQFFPESGRIISGKFTLIAFKATDNEGRGTDLKGTLYNSRDSAITNISTEHNGMGKFRFYAASADIYYVLVPDGKGGNHRFNLPPAEHQGAAINVLNRDGRIFINTLITNDFISKGANILVHDGDEILFFEELTRDERVFILNENNLQPGINHILLIDNDLNVLAERLIFRFPENSLQTVVETDKPSDELERREKATIKISLKDSSGIPVKGEFSISVTDSFLAPAQPYSDNLKSYMHLTSELRGQIERAAWYFDESNKDRERAIDLLMMVQGWRYYDLPAILSGDFGFNGKRAANRPWYQKEFTQTVSGRATSNFRNTKRATISVLAPEINLAVSENLNKTGNFIVSDLDFADSTGFIISCTGKEGQKGYYLELAKQTFPSLTYYQFLPTPRIKRDAASDDSYFRIFEQSGGLGSIMLTAATVTSNYKVAAKHNPSPFNQTFDKRQIREREDLDIYAGWSLFDYILGTFPGLMHGGSAEDGSRIMLSTRSATITGEKEEPHVYINRLRVGSTGDLDKYMVDDVENVAFLRGNEGFLYRTLSGVVLVTLRYSVSSLARSPDMYFNTIFARPLGWQKPSKFYSPDYSLEEDNNSVSFDTRTTLYWNPMIKTDEDGKAVITYYSSDRKTRHNISIEGLTLEGEIFSISQ
ncbi:MAG: hypothetical protein CVU12_01665 [Bacteroidetes bacterium HGW-Bacteroidetes-7]|jgi:hypothetical protein|nr:MAG: hypothetical protein CVU12_01665 [Bacteroidetes bacterium HGW-Bacteroidetes-7]